MKKILMPLPQIDFDPTESAIPWKVLKACGFEVVFATPNGKEASADFRMVTGEGLGVFKSALMANREAVQAYREMESSAEFKKPISYERIEASAFDGLILPGGHAPGMKIYLESSLLHGKIAQFSDSEKPIGAICHGVVAAARSGIIAEKRVTALPKWMEFMAWILTFAWLGSYYRTYRISVEKEVQGHLLKKEDFVRGPFSFSRDNERHLSRGFTVVDGHLVTARWPGDAHKFTLDFIALFSL
jgi:protease I